VDSPARLAVRQFPVNATAGRCSKTSTFYALWACYFIGCLAGLMAIGIAKPVGVDVGVESGLATMLVASFAIFNGFGRPVFGTLTDKMNPGIPDDILHTDRSRITAHLADPIRAGIYPCICHTLGMPGRLAGHRPMQQQVISAPAITRGAMAWCSLHTGQVHCRTTVSRVH